MLRLAIVFVGVFFEDFAFRFRAFPLPFFLIGFAQFRKILEKPLVAVAPHQALLTLRGRFFAFSRGGFRLPAKIQIPGHALVTPFLAFPTSNLPQQQPECGHISLVGAFREIGDDLLQPCRLDLLATNLDENRLLHHQLGKIGKAQPALRWATLGIAGLALLPAA